MHYRASPPRTACSISRPVAVGIVAVSTCVIWAGCLEHLRPRLACVSLGSAWRFRCLCWSCLCRFLVLVRSCALALFRLLSRRTAFPAFCLTSADVLSLLLVFCLFCPPLPLLGLSRLFSLLSVLPLGFSVGWVVSLPLFSFFSLFGFVGFWLVLLPFVFCWLPFSFGFFWVSPVLPGFCLLLLCRLASAPLGPSSLGLLLFCFRACFGFGFSGFPLSLSGGPSSFSSLCSFLCMRCVCIQLVGLSGLFHRPVSHRDCHRGPCSEPLPLASRVQKKEVVLRWVRRPSPAPCGLGLVSPSCFSP